MELDLSTLLLEIANFLILVWILKRFLYRPVLTFVARRREETEEAMAAAQRDREESATLKSQYENRLADWARERDANLSRLREEMDQERARRLDETRDAIEQERKKAQVAEARRQREFRAGAEEEALAIAGRFAAQLLAAVAIPEATRALTDLAVEQMGNIDPARVAELRHAGADGRAIVETAHPIDHAQREAVELSLTRIFGDGRRYEWRVVPELLAGIRVVLGAWELTANLRDELHGFTTLAHGPETR